MKASATTRQVLHGSDVTLSCWLRNGSPCGSQPKIFISHNNSGIHCSYGHLASTRTLLSKFGQQKFECRCSGRIGRQELIVCGIYIYVGIPPDQPNNTVCLQYGKDGTTHCTWEKGRYTYVATDYILQLQTNGITTGMFVETGNNAMCGSVDLRVRLDYESTYTAVVLASNDLGNASSQPIQFTLMDIVKPHSPVNISVKCDDFDATNCTVSWQDQQETEHFRLRYQPIGSNAWTVLENITSRRHVLWGLKQDSEYEFQVSSKFLPNRGLWSDWSVSYQIEAVPCSPVDVWYLKEDISPELQNITLFWKTVSLSETRRKSNYYTVTFQSLTQKHQRAAETISPTETIFSKVTPKRAYKIILNSYNARGASPLTIFTTELGSSDVPPPYNLSATSMGNGTIFVAWEAPLARSQFISGYVVEWAKFHQGSNLKTHADWLKVPESKLTAKIENLEPNMCYLIRVFGLYRNRAGKAALTTGDASARDIPEDAPQSFSVKNIQPSAAYDLWMTASTTAGESPPGNKEVIYIKKSHEFAPVLAICIILGLLACVCLVPSARQMVFSILSVFLTGWYSKAIPDPANSSWAKEFISVKDESSLYSTPFLNHLHSFEEPETLQIEEVFIKKFQVYKDVLLFQSTEKGESPNWLPGSSSPEEGTTEKDSDYNPLVTSTLYNTNTDTQQLPSLYRKVAPEETTQGQMFSEYLANTLEDETDYLPLANSPTVMNTNEDGGEPEFSSFSGFPGTSFVPQTFSFGGKLTLDAVRMDCNSFPDY
ncbi:interleukin-12 receptor subunit beta-2 [Tiliqua scincoides]|uniref:interleukin-12 receptor subunit beta-2 n=1 Tax=Tiliqua scincoides TaxID=71010 RepID=UPI0034625960